MFFAGNNHNNNNNIHGNNPETAAAGNSDASSQSNITDRLTRYFRRIAAGRHRGQNVDWMPIIHEFLGADDQGKAMFYRHRHSRIGNGEASRPVNRNIFHLLTTLDAPQMFVGVVLHTKMMIEWCDVSMESKTYIRDMLRQKDAFGLIPLHYACFRSHNNIEQILKACKEGAAVQSSDGPVNFFPIQYYFTSGGKSPHYINLLLNAYPEGSFAGSKSARTEENVFLKVCTDFKREMDRVKKLDMKRGENPPLMTKKEYWKDKKSEIHQTMKIFLCARHLVVYQSPMDSGGNFLSHLLGSKRETFAELMWTRALEDYITFYRPLLYCSGGVNDKNTPLHNLLLSEKRWNMKFQPLQSSERRHHLMNIFDSIIPRQMRFSEEETSHPRPLPKFDTKKVVDLILRFRVKGLTAASVKNGNGDLPLHYALKLGYTWDYCISSLAHAEPRSCCTRDRTSGLYPFMMAATSKSSDLDTSYQILRFDPSIIDKFTKNVVSFCDIEKEIVDLQKKLSKFSSMVELFSSDLEATMLRLSDIDFHDCQDIEQLQVD